MTDLDATLARIDTDLPQSIDRLMDLIRIPSISTDPAYRGDCARAADWLVAQLTDLGFQAESMPTPGHPMVVARHQGPGRHILFYGHYDVQPVDPLDLWDRAPFDPALIDGPRGQAIHGRGASDDKGQLMTFIEACRAWKAVHGTLPGNLTIFLEGEEESGSPSLIPFLTAHKDRLAADIALICDTDLYADGRPSIVTMLRGLVGEEVTIRAARRDLHSGMYGGLAQNPARILARIIAGLHDETGRVTLPGFYDGVDPLPQAIADDWQALDFDAAAFLGDVGLSLPAGERGRSPLEMVWSQPTCEVNGITGGYTGDGFKTVLPGVARAKISLRLVGRQDPQAIRAAFRDYVRAQLPADVTVEFSDHGASPASVMSIDDPAFAAARAALSEEWGREAAFIGSGGSIPVAGDFQRILGMDSMLIGFARPDDRIHSPNEKYDVESFHKGMRSWARILARLTA
ncbi:M20/M25/M40 family metallo-hydrolase [Paracoccus sp. p4-l81]|uniref:M20/M25/M40 family metallo-hydrolase n=1 Tax=unclassified Paracoccus (in: a-proteobacteria) TaxID=2688777 RepID=UPI0035BB1664